MSHLLCRTADAPEPSSRAAWALGARVARPASADRRGRCQLGAAAASRARPARPAVLGPRCHASSRSQSFGGRERGAAPARHARRRGTSTGVRIRPTTARAESGGRVRRRLAATSRPGLAGARERLPTASPPSGRAPCVRQGRGRRCRRGSHGRRACSAQPARSPRASAADHGLRRNRRRRGALRAEPQRARPRVSRRCVTAP
jgi:hypothetical protein